MLLLRHVSAGGRLSSPAIDRFRRLDETGRVTARQLVWSLVDHDITRIVTSPFPRCVETVIPLAESRGLVVEHRWELAPDSDVEDILVLLADLPATALVCTHREVFEKLLGEDAQCEKGSVWLLERHGSELIPTLYLAPPLEVPARVRQAV